MHRSPGQRESWRTTPPRCTEAPDRWSLGIPHPQDAQEPRTDGVLAYHTPKMHRSPGQMESWRTTPPRCTEAPDRGSLGVPHPQDAQKPWTEGVLAYHIMIHCGLGLQRHYRHYHYTLDSFLLQNLQVNPRCGSVLKNSDPVISSSTTQLPHLLVDKSFLHSGG